MITLIIIYFYSNLNYFPLVRTFFHAKSLKKEEALQKRTLRFLYNDYNSPSEEILKKFGKVCMEINRLNYLCIEIYKTIDNVNPSFMKKSFNLEKQTGQFEISTNYNLGHNILELYNVLLQTRLTTSKTKRDI